MLIKKGDEREIMSVDGKHTNGTKQGNGRSPNVVSAHPVNSGMTVYTVMCDTKSNEITTDPKVIDKAVHEGVVVTLDAISTFATN